MSFIGFGHVENTFSLCWNVLKDERRLTNWFLIYFGDGTTSKIKCDNRGAEEKVGKQESTA